MSATHDFSLFIGGDWVSGAEGRTFVDLDPFSAEPVATVAAATRVDAARAVAAAETAWPQWAQTPPAERQRVFLAAAGHLERRRDEIVPVRLRPGDGLHVRLRHVPAGVRPRALPPGGCARLCAAWSGDPLRPPGNAGAGNPQTGYGVVGAIAPWNWPR